MLKRLSYLCPPDPVGWLRLVLASSPNADVATPEAGVIRSIVVSMVWRRWDNPSSGEAPL